MKYLEENLGENIYKFVLGKYFFKMTQIKPKK